MGWAGTIWGGGLAYRFSCMDQLDGVLVRPKVQGPGDVRKVLLPKLLELARDSRHISELAQISVVLCPKRLVKLLLEGRICPRPPLGHLADIVLRWIVLLIKRDQPLL